MADGRIEIDTRINERGLQTGLASVQNRLEGAGKKMKSIGTKMTGFVTAPVLGLGAAAIMAGANFEEGMSKVAAISGATGKDFKALEDQAKLLGETTKYSATEAAEGMAFLAMAGFKTSDILSSMPGMLALASAGTLDLGQAADIASNIMTGFGVEAERSGHVADVLAYAAANANTDVAQLGEAMKYLAPSASALGWTLEESTAAVMAFGDAGIQGGMAGQAFASSLTRLSKGAGKAGKMANSLGIEFFTAKGKMKPLPDLLAHMEEQMAGLTQEQRAGALTTMFGSEAFKHWENLLKAGSGTIKENTKALIESDGAAQRMSDTMNDNLKGDFKTFLSALERVSIAIYDKVGPSLREFVQGMTGLVRKFKELSPSAMTVILVIAGIAAAIGPVILVAGLMVTAISALIPVFAAISGPVVLIVAAIAAFVAALVAAYMKSEEFRNKVNGIFGAIRDFAVAVWERISTYIMEKVSQIKTFWDEHGTQIMNAVTNVFNAIKAVIDFIMPAITWVIELAWTTITMIIDGALGMIMGLIKVFAGIFTLDFSLIWEGIKQILKGAVEFLLGMLNVSFFGGIKNIFVSLGKFLFNSAKKMADDVIKFFVNLYKGAYKAVDDMFVGVTNFFFNLFTTSIRIFGQLRTFGASIFEAIKQAIVGPVRNAYNTVKGLFQSIFTAAKHRFQGVYDSARTIFGKVRDAITKPIEKAKEAVRAAVDAIKGFFRNMKVKIPMPRINFKMGTKNFMGVNVPVPNFDVEWFAKGGLFAANSPRLIGVGDNKRYQEAALPLSPQVLGFIANKLSAHMPNGGTDGQLKLTVVNRTELDGRTISEEIYETVTELQEFKNGREVKFERGPR